MMGKKPDSRLLNEQKYCVRCVWSTETFESYSQVLAFYHEAKRILDQICCCQSDKCDYKVMSDNNSMMQLNLYLRNVPDFVAVLETIKSIFSGRSPYHQVTSIDHICEEKTEAQMRLFGVKGSSIAMGAMNAFDAYLELNGIGGKTIGTNRIGGEKIGTVNDVVNLGEVNLGGDMFCGDAQDSNAKVEVSAMECANASNGKSSPPRQCMEAAFMEAALQRYSIKVVGLDGSLRLDDNRKRAHELASLLKMKCPGPTWIVSSFKQPSCTVTESTLSAFETILRQLARDCIDFIGSVCVRHPGDKPFTTMNQADLRQIYGDFPDSPRKVHNEFDVDSQRVEKHEMDSNQHEGQCHRGTRLHGGRGTEAHRHGAQSERATRL